MEISKYAWDDVPEESLAEGLSRRVITGEKGMVSKVYLRKGAVVPKHEHVNEQLTYIVSGVLRFWLGEDLEREIDVQAGEVLVIPSGIPHKAEALEDTVDMDFFSPPRQDWLDGSDAYIRSNEAGV